ncbi:MAG TPA: DUF2493 domain-containing protein [Firmicutes bacterium]|nr:DUF2493 domain-containing protein [Bacillota bacterium]
MKVAVIGSRSLHINIAPFLPPETTMLISGGASGIDRQAEICARANHIPIRVFLPDYRRYPPKIAPLLRNQQIVAACDLVLAIWDGRSRGTKYTIEYAQKIGKPVDLRLFTHMSGSKSWSK